MRETDTKMTRAKKFEQIQLPKGPFKYYVIIFLTFLGPPAFNCKQIYSTVNHQILPISDPTRPPLFNDVMLE